MQTIINRGYLLEDYRLFHSTDRRDLDFQTHSHDFHKVVFCLSGQVTYIMEGTTYYLRASDTLLVPEHQIHQSIISSVEAYERIILWISDAFLQKHSEPALTELFHAAAQRRSALFRPEPAQRAVLIDRLTALERAQAADYPGHALMSDTYLLQFLLELYNMLRASGTDAGASRADPRFQQMLEYINCSLTDDLSVNAIAQRFYISPSHLMHAFKKHTGCTLHRYVTEKRLIYAAALIADGESVTRAAERSGFSDYSTFLKAYRRLFGGLSPKRRAVPAPDSSRAERAVPAPNSSRAD